MFDKVWRNYFAAGDTVPTVDATWLQGTNAVAARRHHGLDIDASSTGPPRAYFFGASEFSVGSVWF